VRTSARAAGRLALALCSAWLAAAPASGLTASEASDGALAAPSYRLDPGHTFVHWSVLHMGTSTTRGRFDRLNGQARFSPEKRLIEVGIEVDTASVSTGLAAFDAVMRGGPLLDVQNHPKAWFTARQAVWEGEAPQELMGEITLKGKSQALNLKALRWRCAFNPLFRKQVCGGDFEARLTRSAFDMSVALPFVADEVLLQIQVEAIRED